jgi:hypothetical protein
MRRMVAPVRCACPQRRSGEVLHGPSQSALSQGRHGVEAKAGGVAMQLLGERAMREIEVSDRVIGDLLEHLRIPAQVPELRQATRTRFRALDLARRGLGCHGSLPSGREPGDKIVPGLVAQPVQGEPAAAKIEGSGCSEDDLENRGMHEQCPCGTVCGPVTSCVRPNAFLFSFLIAYLTEYPKTHWIGEQTCAF